MKILMSCLEEFVTKLFSGVCDMFAISITCILTGYFWIVGANYCTSPDFMYIIGALVNGNHSNSPLGTSAYMLQIYCH